MTALLALLAATAAVAILLALRLRGLHSDAATREAELRVVREAQSRDRAARAALESQIESERRAHAEKQGLLERKLADQFDALSRRALQANNEQFLQLARESLGALTESARGDLEKRQQAIGELVRPVQESLSKVDGQIQQLEKARVGAYA